MNGIKGMEMSVLEKQRIMFLKWQQEQLQQNCFIDMSMLSFLPAEQGFHGPAHETGPTINELLNRPIKGDPGCEYGLMDFETPKCGNTLGNNGMNYEEGRKSFKKRKAERNPSAPKGVNIEEDNKSKRSKGCFEEEEESRITEQYSNRQSSKNQSNQKESNGSKNEKKNKELSGCTSKDNSEVQKPDYIHVRARRGQATDSHSLAERVRREKISERMKYLQDLVPGCSKITGKAGMLDEIIIYVQSLQKQVEFLSMKLAATNPRFDLSIDDIIPKEILGTCSTNLPAMGLYPEVINPNYPKYNPIEQTDHGIGSAFALNQVDLDLKASICAPVSIPDTFIDTSYFNQIPHSLQWNSNIQNFYNMEFQ